jgi:hypothetical protein
MILMHRVRTANQCGSGKRRRKRGGTGGGGVRTVDNAVFCSSVAGRNGI